IQQRLDDLYAAAREEGTVRIGGHPSDFRRDAWLVFEERYPGINVEYVALAGSEANSRLQSEWENGVWEWDILATGATYLLGSYATENHLLDVHDVIFDPEVLDDSVWLGGGFDANFLDAAGRYMFAYHVFIAETAFVRDDLAPVDSFESLADLLNPEYQGKVCWVDPRLGGTPQFMAAFLLQSQGEQFVRDLLTVHEPQIFGSTQEMVTEMVRTDDCPIGIGVTRPVLKEFQDQGLGTTIMRIEPPDGRFQGGSNFVSVPVNAPHPNAAQLMANWFLTQDGQTQWAEKGRENSRRLDVPLGNAERMPNPEVEWFDFSTEEANYFVCCLLPVRTIAEEALAGR
ncbi:MAG: extracellular solute-binding protein, partial [Chloroflexota bacterium]|nr:extracellular solute-binding protein [Chloroflexota bacterium]